MASDFKTAHNNKVLYMWTSCALCLHCFASTCMCCRPFNIAELTVLGCSRCNKLASFLQPCPSHILGFNIGLFEFWGFEKEWSFISSHSIMHAALLFYNALSAADNWWVKSCSPSQHRERLPPFQPPFFLLFHLPGPVVTMLLLASHEAAVLHPKATLFWEQRGSESLCLISECVCQGERWMSRESHKALLSLGHLRCVWGRVES